MLNIYEVQCSLNRAVSSFFHLNGYEDETNSLKLLLSSLELFNIPNSNHNFHNSNKLLSNSNRLVSNSNRLESNSNRLECSTNEFKEDFNEFLDNSNRLECSINEFKEDFNEFLDNLNRVLLLFSTRILKMNLNNELCHLYIKIFLKITNILNYYKFEYKCDILSISLIKIWSEILCTNDHINSSLERNLDIFNDFLPLILNVYNSLENGNILNKILYIILEIFTQTNLEEYIVKILESLETIPCNLNLFEVYPGVISRIVNKLTNCNRILFSKSIYTLTIWIKYFLNTKINPKSNKILPNNLINKFLIKENKENKENILNKEKEEIEEKIEEFYEKTIETINYIIKYKNRYIKSICLFCCELIEYEFLDNKLKIVLANIILNSIDDLKLEICKFLQMAPISFKLILRDIITKSINENDENSIKHFNTYLILLHNSYKPYNNSSKLPNNSNLDNLNLDNCSLNNLVLSLDNYLVLRFLLYNVKIDYSGILEKRLINNKYLLDTCDTTTYETNLKMTEINTISMLYFNNLAVDIKITSISDLILVYKNANIQIKIRTLILLNELIISLFQSQISNHSSDLIFNLKFLIKQNLFNPIETVDTNPDTKFTNTKFSDTKLTNTKFGDTELTNEREFTNTELGDTEFTSESIEESTELMYKIKLIELLITLIRNSNREYLTHYDMENLLFNIIPQYNSDYIKLSESSFHLLNELNNYFNKFIKPNSTKLTNEQLTNECINLKEQLPNEKLPNEQLTKECINLKEECINGMLEYYSNSLIKKIINNIDMEIIPDLIYTLTNYNFIDLKTIYDLVIQFCKYFDQTTQFFNSLDKKLLNIFYIFNYILIYINQNINPIKKNLQKNTILKNLENQNEKLLENQNEKLEKEKLEKEENENEDGKGDYILTISTLIITRSRYYINNKDLEYLSLLAMYRSLILCSKNEYIFRIRIHEIWDCLVHSLELNIKRYKIITILLEIIKLIIIITYQFIENRLMIIFGILEQMILNEEILGIAEEKNSTMRYKCYYRIVELMELISEKVINRILFSEILLFSIKMHSIQIETLKNKLLFVTKNLSRKNPTLVRNVLIEISKGKNMNIAFIKYALKKDLKYFLTIPPQIKYFNILNV